MSLGGGVSQAMNDAVNAAVEAVITVLYQLLPYFTLCLSSSYYISSHPHNSMQGVSFSVSAGNDAGDACKKSPASAADWYAHIPLVGCNTV